MAPLRLLAYNVTNDKFSLVYPSNLGGRVQYHILSYTWADSDEEEQANEESDDDDDDDDNDQGDQEGQDDQDGQEGPEGQEGQNDQNDNDGSAGLIVGIEGVTWKPEISQKKLDGIKQFVRTSGVTYLWVDSLCINQDDRNEVNAEMGKMHDYYTNAVKCHILLDMAETWDPRGIVNDLRFVDHILAHMHGATLAESAGAMMGRDLTARLREWEDGHDWRFDMDKQVVQAAGFELGVFNCYATSIERVQSVFRHRYFERVWTFQEMLLGKMITMWVINGGLVSPLGELDAWMNLASDAQDRAVKLYDWVDRSREVKSAAVNAILGLVKEDLVILTALQTQVRGITSARIDIISGGPSWWVENHRGIRNVFSAISLRARKSKKEKDLFKGLLGVFNGLFTAAEIERDLEGTDIEALSFAFFKQLSIKTKRAWTRLVTSSRERGEWDWIPVLAKTKASKKKKKRDQLLTTDCFAGVVDLGRLKPDGGLAKAKAQTGIVGTPRQFMTLTPIPISKAEADAGGFRFSFQGCNLGKKVNTGLFRRREAIGFHGAVERVQGDETGRTLVKCATLLGKILDPNGDLLEYRRRLLVSLQPWWWVTDRNAKPPDWINRCVSGTPWANPELREHNWSMNVHMADVWGCGSRLQNKTTARLSCELRVNCGCVVTGPYSLMMEAVAAVQGGVLGGEAAGLDSDGRITLRDGVGLAQVGDVGKAFRLVAFQGDSNAHKTHASKCRSTKQNRPVEAVLEWPRGRMLVREDFSHGMTDMTRDYGFVETGVGNLLICRDHPLDKYRVVGVCIDGPAAIVSKKGEHEVTVR